MLEMISEVTGVVIAAGIIAGVKKLGDLTNAVRDLDRRVSLLELWLQRPRVSERPGRTDEPFAAEIRGRDCTS